MSGHAPGNRKDGRQADGLPTAGAEVCDGLSRIPWPLYMQALIDRVAANDRIGCASP